MNKKNIVSIMMVLAVVIGLSSVAHAELTEAQKKALEVALTACQSLPAAEVKACETAAMNNAGSTTTITPPPTTTTTKVATASMSGRISAIGANTVTVGIIGGGTVNVTANTEIKYNGKIATLASMFVGDTISVKYETVTKNATLIEAEGYYFSAIYTGTAVKVLYVGLIGNAWNALHYGMVTSNGAGTFLQAATQVTINGVPATYLDIKAGDTIDYVAGSVDLNGIFVKITR